MIRRNLLREAYLRGYRKALYTRRRRLYENTEDNYGDIVSDAVADVVIQATQGEDVSGMDIHDVIPILIKNRGEVDWDSFDAKIAKAEKLAYPQEEWDGMMVMLWCRRGTKLGFQKLGVKLDEIGSDVFAAWVCSIIADEYLINIWPYTNRYYKFYDEYGIKY